MNELKNSIVDEIIHFLAPLHTLYETEINQITNDLLINKTDSLEDFINTHYKDIPYSKEITELIKTLIENKLISKKYTKLLQNTTYTLIPFSFTNISFHSSKPLNIKIKNLANLKEKSNIKKESVPTQPKLSNETSLIIDDDDDVTVIPEKDIEKLKKSIIEAQLNYLKNATTFIKELEEKHEEEIYNSLLNLNDIRYIHHCILNLNSETLERFLAYIENHLKNNTNNSIDMFMKEAIKLHLRNESK